MDYNLIFIIISIFIAFLLTNYFIIGFFKHSILQKETFSSKYPTGFCSHEGKLGIRLFDGNNYSCVAMDNVEAEDVNNNRLFGPKNSDGINSRSIDDDNNNQSNSNNNNNNND